MAKAGGQAKALATERGNRAAIVERSRLTELLGFRLRQAENVMHRDFILALKPCDLTQKQLAVLLLIRENPGIAQIELCSALGVDPNTVIAFIDRLADRKLICRLRSAVDRRKTELHVTVAGRQLLDRALVLVAEHEAGFRARFSDGELAQLMAYLDRFSDGPDV